MDELIQRTVYNNSFGIHPGIVLDLFQFVRGYIEQVSHGLAFGARSYETHLYTKARQRSCGFLGVFLSLGFLGGSDDHAFGILYSFLAERLDGHYIRTGIQRYGLTGRCRHLADLAPCNTVA